MRYIRITVALLLIMAFLLPTVAFPSDAASSAEVQSFLETLGPMATQDMLETGILASLTMAQGIYESGWGTSWMAKNINNLFGIKAYEPAWQGKVYCRKTQKIYTDFADAKKKLGDLYKEYVGQFFRVYNSWADSVKDHSTLFTTMSRYENLVGLTDYKLACRYVKEDGYCDTEGYDDMLIKIIEQYKLYKYDVSQGVTSVDMGVESLVLTAGEAVKVYPTVRTEDGSAVYLRYSSGNGAVATVDGDGVITGVSQGAAVITVSTTNGRSDTCVVYVRESGTVLRSGVITSAVNCRTEPYDTGGSATVLGGFAKGAEIVVFGDAARTKWYLISGFGTRGELLCGYSYGNYFTIGEEFSGDTPVEHSEEGSEEPSEDVSPSEESIPEESTEPVSEQFEEPVSEESSAESEDTGLRIGRLLGDLNCRKGASLDQSSLGVFAKGSNVLIIGDAVNTRWYLCAGINKSGKFVEGYSGFVTSDGKTTYITVEGDFTETTGAPLVFSGGCVTGIENGTTVGELAASMKYAELTALSPNGTLLDEDELIRTGVTLEFKWCGKTYLSKTAAVRGDINCDGAVNELNYLLGGLDLTESQELAARFAGGSEVDVNDYMALRLYLAGK